MDKFFYRLTVQALIKCVLTAVISLFVTALAYTLFVSILQPVSARVDYWLEAIVLLVVTVITCFMLISVKDSYSATSTDTYQVGRFWADRAQKGKKVHWLAVDLMMAPLLALALVFAFLFYGEHADVLAAYEAFYAVENVGKSAAQGFFIDNFPHFIKLVLAVFFFGQWRHVRGFAKAGRCPSCKAAFSLGCHGPREVRTTEISKITKKGKNVVVGANYQVTTEDGEVVDKTKISDVYGKTYQSYQTNTRTTFTTNVCRCAFCSHISQKTDVYTASTTKKLP